MLERATGCVENAGQRLFWHSGNVVRSRRSLRPRFWHHGELDMPAWCFAFLHAAYQAPGRRRPYRRLSTSAQDDSCHLHLDFLYPSHARSAARSDVPRKHNIARKRGKLPTNSSRNYASGPSKSFRESRRYNSSVGTLSSPAQLSLITLPLDTDRVQETPSQRLDAILQLRDQSDYDEAWTLYQSIENRGEFLFPMLSCLTHSSRDIDAKRSQDVLLEIPVGHRSREKYVSVTEALLRTGKYIDSVKEVVQDAVSHNMGPRCWSVAFGYCVKEMRWTDMQDLWKLKPLDIAAYAVRFPVDRGWEQTIPDSLLTLTDAMEAKTVDLGNSIEIPKFLLYVIFRSSWFLSFQSMKWILNVTQNLHNLGLLEPGHYLTAINTFCYTLGPYDAERSVLLYRNFCWRMTTRPPRIMLMNLINILRSFRRADQIGFVVDEFRFFYGTLPPKMYRLALQTLARAGNAPGVDRVLELFRRDYEDPDDPLFYYIPYLYVYARLGQVRQTRARFRNLRVFGSEQNIHCWNVLLAAYANASDSRGAFSVFEQMRERGLYNSHTIGTLTGMCAKSGDTDKVDDLLEVAAEYEIPITASILDATVESRLQNGRFEDAERKAEEAVYGNYDGDLSRMWNMIIVRYAYRYDLESAIRVKERMNDLGIRSTSETCSALILAFAMVGRTNDARLFLREMHRESPIRATEFHYSLLLTGFVRERNRNMVNVIYHEMKQRFHSDGVHTRLAMLQANIQRDLQLHYEQGGSQKDRNIKLAHAERFLNDSVYGFNPRAAKLQKNNLLSFKHTLPTSHYEKMISAYGANGAFELVDTLFNKYNSINQAGEHPLRLLGLLMGTHLKREQYDKVCACWDMAFARTTILTSQSSSYGSDISVPDVVTASTPVNSTVYPAYRFVLSRCISHYLQALGHQNLHSKIPNIVQGIEEKGFSLSTQNWSMYVKMLATSENAVDQLRAFSAFEEKFMPNYRGWRNIVRGRGLRPPGAPKRKDIVSKNSGRGAVGLEPRQIWANTRPDFKQLTYTTGIYLASALRDFTERSVHDEGAELKSLYDAAPKTFTALTQLPEIHEKFQEVLIRRNEVEDHLPRRFRFSKEAVSTKGVLWDIDDPIGLDANEEGNTSEHTWEDTPDHEEGG